MAAVLEKVRPKGKGEEKEGTLRKNDHEFSDYTRRLLQVVSRLLRRVEKVRNGNGDVKEVGNVLKAVKMKKEELQGQIMRRLFTEVMVLKREKEGLDKRADEIFDKALKVGREKQNLAAEKLYHKSFKIRRRMKKYGGEKRFVVKTPEDEVIKGFPEVEMKWMFGDKEVVVPKAISLHLYHGWKKWREEAKADIKRNLLEDADFGKQYVAERQERILLDRDRVVAKTWYNEEKSRWEMDPMAVPYAVSKKLVEHARIRHDWAMMYIALKGDDKEYFVDIKVT
ncbi:hypothetical protein COLO4_15521 [Corchorus olitorius]|uniref:Uncharacterized protein n=1 Tax=Corchorus olitorius TaxID=93759 RepID=A0A1R3JMS8_9ROSI|nr:hypothetical protein COLO4_15521 [Corchorus olitorius]